MSRQLVFRPLVQHESIHAVSVFRAAFDENYVNRTIYVASGVAKYLANVMKAASLSFGPQHLLIGCWRDETLIGYVHGRALPSMWHLNNIAVLPEAQNSGIGRKLFENFMEAGRQLGYQRLSLDVEEGNHSAFAWYQSLGFVKTSHSTIDRISKWVSINEGASSMPLDIRVFDWENAQAWWTAYGFAQFRVEADAATWMIGRFGRYFRLDRLPSRQITSVLGTIDSTALLLIISHADSTNEEPLENAIYWQGIERIAVTQRMEMSMPASTHQFEHSTL